MTTTTQELAAPLEQAVHTQGERETFKRENRYIVIKRKDLALVPVAYRRHLVEPLGSLMSHIPHRECVVVESDWPEYETVWRMIEARVTGESLAQPSPAPELEHIHSLISVFRNATRDDANNGGREYFEKARSAEQELRQEIDRIVGALRAELEAERDLVKVLQEQNDALRSTAEDAQAGQVLEGWKPVPIEPTEDLLEAIHRGGYVGDDGELRWFYKSILDAAPALGGE
ncbi:hypothetical protein PCLA_13f0067 [Pseudomonas citronellolis]|uniref:hypothetical protein n=1 Tax=Pseudomonas citronellolis TaxID=53408 RepID=UPI000E2E8C59|nr:hypothetical protein [Pseudomonas citronellolis]GBL59221.1 hypothetical protein PCLA_13f0067 [Pseudomonas citronellolis]